MANIFKWWANFLVIIAALVLGFANHSEAKWGVIRRVDTSVNIHAGRSKDTNIVGKLRKGDRIRADFLRKNWYAVFLEFEKVRDEKRAIGYVYAPLLKPIRAKSATPKLSYRIFDRKELNYGGSQQMEIWVLLKVRKIPTETAMRQVAETIWRDGNKGWDEFTVWMYLPGMDMKGLTFGLVVFRKTELVHFSINHAARWGTRWQPRP
ncbi:MAG: hypothetical protein ACE5FB_04325 [Candidatus Binatia bacterium]